MSCGIQVRSKRVAHDFGHSCPVSELLTIAAVMVLGCRIDFFRAGEVYGTTRPDANEHADQWQDLR